MDVHNWEQGYFFQDDWKVTPRLTVNLGMRYELISPFIDKNDMLYVSDSESEDAPGKDTNNPGCKRGIRVGSVKDGKVQFYIPPPSVPDPKFPPPEGVAADSNGTIYAAAVQAKEVYKYVKK